MRLAWVAAATLALATSGCIVVVDNRLGDCAGQDDGAACDAGSRDGVCYNDKCIRTLVCVTSAECPCKASCTSVGERMLCTPERARDKGAPCTTAEGEGWCYTRGQCKTGVECVIDANCGCIHSCRGDKCGGDIVRNGEPCFTSGDRQRGTCSVDGNCQPDS